MFGKRKKELRVEQQKSRVIWLVLVALIPILVVGYLVTQKGCNSTPTANTDTLYIPGKTATLYIPGKTDTVTKYVSYPVYIEKPAGIHYGKDSSQYNVANLNGSYEVVTFPATDSIRIEIEPITIEHFITQVDTVIFHTTDTLKITNTIELESPWYNTFLAGAGSVVMIVLTVLGLVAL
jgi:hypothetical protein